MCKIDFDHELENAWPYSKIYPSLEALRDDHPCCDECGFLQVEVKQVRIIKESTF